MKKRQLVILGGGSAGMAVAIEAYKYGIRDILIIEKNDYLGGILDQCIHNGFGLEIYREELTGPEFMTRLAEEIKKYQIEVKLSSAIISVSAKKEVTYLNEKEGKVTLMADAIVATLGCYERNAGAIKMSGTRPSGIYTAGQAQLYLNNYGYLVGKNVYILGSGDIGLIMARRMTLEGAKVLGVMEIMPYSNGLNRNIVQCLNDYDIPLHLSTTVKRVIGKNRLEAIEVVKVDENLNYLPGTEKILACDTLLLSIGLVPYMSLFKNLPLRFNKAGGLFVSNYLESDIPGIFSSGNSLHVHDLVDLVVLESRECALGIKKYLQGELNKRDKQIEIKPSDGVSYIIPNIIYLEQLDDDVSLKLRVKRPYRNVSLEIFLNDKMIKSIYKMAIIPSEMEIIKIKKELLNEEGKLIIKVKEK